MNQLADALELPPVNGHAEKQIVYSREEIRQAIDKVPLAAESNEPAAKPEPCRKLVPISAGTLLDENPEEEPWLIDGLLRRGEVMNLVAPPKRGKTWLVHLIAITAVMGFELWGKFKCTPCRVLIIDAELRKATLSFRLRTIAESLGVPIAEYSRLIDVMPLRGEDIDYTSLELHGLMADTAGQYDLIIFDANYKFIPPGCSENDNGHQTRLMNIIIRFAKLTGAAFILVDHTSKGIQGNKSVVDTGAGASAKARSADNHTVMREHEDQDVIVFECAPRSTGPLPPMGLRFQYPLWRHDPFIDCSKLKKENARGAGRKPDEEKAEAAPEDFMTPEQFVDTFITSKRKSKAQIEVQAVGYKVGRRRLSARDVDRLLKVVHAEKLVHGSTNDREKYYQLPLKGGK